MIVTPQVIPAAQDFMLFSEVSDKDMIELGLPEDMLSFVRGILDAEDFYEKKSSFPADAFENLSWLVEGFPLAEVKALAKEEQEVRKVSDNLADALESPETLKSFVVVEGEEELRRIMAEPLEKWRVCTYWRNKEYL